MRRRGSVTRVLLLGLLLAAGVAQAQSKETASLPSLDLERLELNPGAAGSLVVGTGELLRRGDLRISAMGQYQHNPLVLARGEERYQIIGSRVTTHLMAAWSLTSWLEFGAQLPLVALQQGADLRQDGIAQPMEYGLGSPTVSARWGLLSQHEGKPVDVALGLGVGLSLGSETGLELNERFRYFPNVMVGRRFGWFRLALEVQALLRPSFTPSQDAFVKQFELGNELRFGAVAATVGKRLRWELNVRGAVPLVDQPSSVELLLGPRYLANPTMEVFALAGLGVGSAPGTPLFRVMLGTAFGSVIPPQLPGESSVKCSPDLPHTVDECPDMDEDLDGVRNGSDRCPMETGTLERNGCPRRDLDGDGIEDALDACPTEVGEAAWKGCPMPDDDGDGVENERDSCPTDPGPPDGRGCPVKDEDGDGLEDDMDLCPALAGPKERDGCPELDSDKDGLANRLDSCPKEAGTPENHGCPKHEFPLVTLTRTKLEPVGKVFFVPGNPKLEARSFLLLNWVAKVIHEHPEFPLIVIGGHTDNRGYPEANRRLSQARAESVMRYLIEQGIAPERLEARGYGGERPIESNATSMGRENNRRVEFTIIWPE